MRNYTITIEGERHGIHVLETYNVRGYGKDDALRSLYRSCRVDPFIEQKIVIVSLDK